MKTRRIISSTLILVLLVAFFAGCTKSPEPLSPDNLGTPKMGGDITVGIAQDFDATLDPHSILSAATREFLFNTYEGLVKPTPDAQFVPAVAESYSVSPSGDAYTFKLRADVMFHNGNIVKVEDVVYSLRRAAGLDTGKALVPGLSIVESVEASDESTIVVNLTEPNIEVLASLTAPIIPDGNDPTTDMIGTGPFKFSSRVPTESIVIEKFAEYWGKPAYLDKITYKVIESVETIIMSLKSGAVDFAPHLSPSNIFELGEGFNVVEGTMNIIQALYINHARAPFDNPDVRRALSYAIDKYEVMEYTSDGKGIPLGSSIYPTFSQYFRDDLVDYYVADTAKAKQLLADAGYPDGFTMEITVPTIYSIHVDAAVVIAEQLKEIGVTVNIKQVDWPTWLTETYIGRDYQTTIIGLDANFLAPRYLLERFTSTSSSNFISFNNEEYDSVFQEALSCLDENEKIVLYGRLQEILAEEAANVYFQDVCDMVAMQANMGGYEYYPLYVVDMSKVYFTE